MLTLNEALKYAGLPQKLDEAKKISLDVPEMVIPKFMKSNPQGGTVSALRKELKAWLVSNSGHDAERIDAWIKSNKADIDDELDGHVE